MYIIRHRYLFVITGLIIVLACFAIMFVFGLKPGIDFTGGSLMEVRYGTVPEKTAVEDAVTALDLDEFAVRLSESDAGTGYLISTRDLSEEERSELAEALTSIGEGGEVERFTSIGPTIGAELQDKAVWAIVAVLALIVTYVGIAFIGIGYPVSSWVYGFMTILMLGHDILVPAAAMSVLGHFIGAEADVLFVTALLTILGFSVNDTIVIFDRVREKLKQNRTEEKRIINLEGGVTRTDITYKLTRPFSELVGEANDETTARSINTSLMVLFALIALYLFGGEVTEMFVFVLIVGVIAGAYSSIFIATPLLVIYEEKMRELRSKKQ